MMDENERKNGLGSEEDSNDAKENFDAGEKEAIENAKSDEVEFIEDEPVEGETLDASALDASALDADALDFETLGVKDESEIKIADESHETVVVPVRKGKKPNLSAVLLVLLSAVLIGGTTYTIGYYKGQINLNEASINQKVEELLENNYKSEIYKSVKEYIDETGINSNLMDADVTEIYKNVGKSIVGITSKTYIYDWFNNQKEAQVTGSGVIFDQTPELFYIVTNYHVISDATDVIVEIAKDQIVNSKIIGYDESTDLAVLSVSKKDVDAELLKEIKPIAIGDSTKLKIGEIAIAIGNPLGYDNTVTQGIISAVDRKVDDDANMMYIQTDAAINPGNSGGALVNGKGELIGINSSKIAETDVEGIGFAIPTEKMMMIVTELMEKGFVSRPYIGIGGIDIDESTADLYDIPVGVLVKYVYEGSPAEKAGVKVMDLIVGIGDESVYSMQDLTAILGKFKPGDTVELKLVRDKVDQMVIPVVLGDRSLQK